VLGRQPAAGRALERRGDGLRVGALAQAERPRRDVGVAPQRLRRDAGGRDDGDLAVVVGLDVAADDADAERPPGGPQLDPVADLGAERVERSAPERGLSGRDGAAALGRGERERGGRPVDDPPGKNPAPGGGD
jgi:hypothetical protein